MGTKRLTDEERKQRKLDHSRNWHSKNKDYCRNKSSLREWYLLKTYNLTLEQYNKMWINQNGCCAICKKHELEIQKLHVDHNHDTGQVRGLLCPQCNKGLGLFYDNKEYLETAIKYLTGEIDNG
jgi:hypothetical protein